MKGPLISLLNINRTSEETQEPLLSELRDFLFDLVKNVHRMHTSTRNHLALNQVHEIIISFEFDPFCTHGTSPYLDLLRGADRHGCAALPKYSRLRFLKGGALK